MKTIITPLLLVFVIQCLLVATVYWPEIDHPQQDVTTALLAISPQTVNAIRVDNGKGSEVLLQRVGKHWVLPMLHELPADQGKVEALLAAFSQTGNDWPAAHSPASRQRFQVASYHYQRRLRFQVSEMEEHTIFLGTAPAFRKVHARRADEDAIYSLAFNIFDAPADANGWLDRRLLQIRSPMSVTADAYSVHWRDGRWVSGRGLAPDERELGALLGSLRSLQVAGVADASTAKVLVETEADLVLQVDSLAGVVTLSLHQLADQYFIHSSEYGLYFRMTGYDFDRLTGIDFLQISGQSPTELPADQS